GGECFPPSTPEKSPPSGASSVLQNYERALRKALGVEKEAIENSTIRVCSCV
ncbi:AGAP008934-PA, partial [Anopheles gambiae str. PEST]